MCRCSLHDIGAYYARNLLSFLLLPVFLLLSLLPVQAQEKRVTITIAKGPLEEALVQLRKATGLLIAFNKADVNGYNVEAHVFKQEAIDHILNELIDKHPFSFERSGQTWVIKK